MRRLIIGGICLSEPGTMGGNSKITLEIARHLCAGREVHFIVPERKVWTVTDALPGRDEIRIHPVVSFAGGEMRHPLAAIRHYKREIDRVLSEIGAGPDDDYFGCSDFYAEEAPALSLQRKYGFRLIPTAFLFVPNPVENLCRGYGFPPFTYFLAWLYAKVYVRFAVRRAAGFVITNESDFRHFPRRFREGRLFPFYGGVNVDQIPAGEVPRTRDVVFCSRLHPQKGIDGFLDVWKRIREKSDARLTVIGNGAPDYERHLKEKAARLGVVDSIDWLGYVNNEAKYGIYRSARVFVHPTVFDNNGMVAAEALCSGLPVVMYDLPALRHVYDVGCLKVPYGDKDAFAAAVVELLADPSGMAPTAEQVSALRRKWDWANRVQSFSAWLAGLVHGPSDRS